MRGRGGACLNESVYTILEKTLLKEMEMLSVILFYQFVPPSFYQNLSNLSSQNLNKVTFEQTCNQLMLRGAPHFMNASYVSLESETGYLPFHKDHHLHLLMKQSRHTSLTPLKHSRLS